MTSQPAPRPPSDDDGLPPYTAPAWYTRRIPVGPDRPDATPIPWYAVGQGTPPPQCHICLAQPVAVKEIRSHTGLVFWGRTRTIAEPLCRQCGIALVRTMTTRTLWQGWWGVLSLLFHTPAALAQNSAAYRQFRDLPASLPPPGRRSLALGKPVLRRPQAYVALLPLAGTLALATVLIRTA
ncbi:hypothetical protein [Streptomyces sp. NPDC050535]|uniref:hypothetical protein n=1 Tax=Streptomyces sp. NPDC050535 TaxID=3365626 RepID=UPI0037BA0ACE